MKNNILKIFFLLAAATLTLTSCDSEEDLLNAGNEIGNSDANLPDGYFRASFFPQPENESTRAAVEGSSEQIQSLICIVYKKQDDNSYKYETEKVILKYEGQEGSVKSYEWPLKEVVTFDLPVGDYKAVFVGNIEKSLFEGQNENELLTNYQSSFEAARINMPELGPAAFKEHNMFYMATVDFSPADPAPYVLLQRVVSKNVYSRTTIDANDAVSMLVDNLVADIRSNQLSTEVVKGVLYSKLLGALGPALEDNLLFPVTSLVDRLVNALLGDVLEYLNEQLVKELTQRVQSTLGADLKEDSGLLGLNYLLNPWLVADKVDVKFNKFPNSIDFNRDCKSYSEHEWKDFSLTVTGTFDKDGLDNYKEIKELHVISLPGEIELAEINVDTDLLLSTVLSQVDKNLLNGLLINPKQKLLYPTESNLQYSTIYELLDLTLSGKDSGNSGEPLSLKIELNNIINLEDIIKQILGDNIISGLIGGLTDKVLQPILDAVSTLVIQLDIKLPGLNLSDINLSGGWGATKVSNGTIAPSITEK